MPKKLTVVFCIVFILTSSVDSSRHNVGHSKKESNVKSGRSPRTRSDVFENLFIIYDPSFLSLVWPKITNGVHVNVERGCWDDLSVLYRALIEGRAWAYSTIDASGRYQPGIFQGNRLWLGSKELCFRLDKEFVSSTKRYNVNTFRRERDFNDQSHDWPGYDVKETLAQSTSLSDDIPSHRLAYIGVQVILNITKFKAPKIYDIALGLCLPRSCSPDDVVSLVNFSIMLNDNLKSNGMIPRTVKIISMRQIQEHYDIKYDTGAVLVILITLILVTLAAVATILDFGLVKCIKKQTRSMSIDMQKYNNKDTYEEQSRKHNSDVVKVIVDLKKEHTINSKEAAKLNKEMLKNLNMNAMKKVSKLNEFPPTITLDVVASERPIANCKRCGKYRKQCGLPKQLPSFPACPQLRYTACPSLTNTEYKQRDNLFLNLLLSFSLKHNCKRLFNTTMANQDLAVVHLLRIFSTFWVIFIHVNVLVNYLSENYTDANAWTGRYSILTTGTLAFDTLLFVSGVFSAHHYFYLSSRYTSQELVSCGGRCGKVLQFVCFVTNRAIRLLPPYVYTIFLTAMASRMWRDTAATVFPEQDYDNCDVYWWRNLLYISLFYPQAEQCMQISWYLSTETQLHVCGALLCVLVTSQRRRSAVLLLNAGLLAATSFDVIRAFTDYHRRFNDIFQGYYYLINRPVGRVAPYLCGVLAGWLVHKAGGRTPVSKVTRCCLWAVSVCVLVASAVTSRLSGHWACAWLHVGWPAALLWPTTTCSTDHAASTRGLLSNSMVAALSRLSYCALLLHGIVARWLLLEAGQAFCSSSVCLWTYFAATSLLTVICGLLLSLLLEMPCCCLLRRICDYAYS